MCSNTNKHLEYLKELDSVLSYISSKGNKITFREQYFKEVSENSFETVTNPNDKYNLAFDFLVSEGFISKTHDGYKMNYSGLMKIGPNSFEETYKRQKRKDDLSKRFWFWMPIIGIISIIFSLAVFANSFFKWW